MKHQFVAVTTTVGKTADAARLAGQIVQSRLAACVQYFPIRSVYRWKGRVEKAGESVLVAKTRATLAGRLIRFIRSKHSYELPEIIVTPITGGLAGYLGWIHQQTTSRQK